MSRSAIDATRFTATSPHAYSKPSALRSSASNTFSPSSVPRAHSIPGTKPSTPQSQPPGNVSAETPAQKVARLRAEHLAQRMAQISTWDKIVVRGRVWADTAHRITALGLIGFSVIAMGVTVFALGDMIIYNRRKRNSFYAEQQMLLQKRLAEAREAAARGIADEDQILLLNRERAAEEAAAALKSKKGIWGTVKGVFTIEGLKKEEGRPTSGYLVEESSEKIGEEAIVTIPATIPSEPTSRIESHKKSMVQGSILKAVDEKRRQGERALEKSGVTGGPLDRIAEQATGSEKSGVSIPSWFSSK